MAGLFGDVPTLVNLNPKPGTADNADGPRCAQIAHRYVTEPLGEMFPTG
jgi:hypothetical protein